MARIAGINIPVQKHIWISLTSIYGIGRTRAGLLTFDLAMLRPRRSRCEYTIRKHLLSAEVVSD